MPRPGTPHPEIPFITLDNAVAQVSEGDIAEITCNYAGTDNTDNNPDKTTYTLGLSLSEEPMLSHKKYKDIEAEEKEALQAIITGKDKDSAGLRLQGQGDERAGQEGARKDPARPDLLLFAQASSGGSRRCARLPPRRPTSPRSAGSTTRTAGSRP